jgi:tetratricopeptide (TPR) repeat protein
MKNFPEAEKDFQKSLEINPTEAVAHNNYGNLLFNNNRFDEARGQFELAIRYNPRYAHALNNLASIYGVMGEGERQLVQSDPANAAQHTANAKRNYETAIGYFQKSIKEDPEYPTPYYLMGITYRNLGDEQSAQFYINKSEEVKKIKRYNAGN